MSFRRRLHLAVVLSVLLPVGFTAAGTSPAALAETRGTGHVALKQNHGMAGQYFAPRQNVSGRTAAAPAAQPVPDALGVANMTYLGGPVETNATNYTVFWMPPLPGDVTVSALYGTEIDGFMRDLPSLSINEVTWQYYQDDSTGRNYINSPRYGGSYDDENVYPGTELTEFDLVTELRDVAARAGWAWPGGLSHTWTVYLGPGEKFCVIATISCTGPGTDVCAEHTFTVPSDTNDYLIYAVVPYAAAPCVSQRGTGTPEGQAAIDATSHEFFEMQTDPTFEAWCGTVPDNSSGCKQNEIADKCNHYDPVYYPLQDANQTYGGRYYLIQGEWANFWAELVIPEGTVDANTHCIVPGHITT